MYVLTVPYTLETQPKTQAFEKQIEMKIYMITARKRKVNIISCIYVNILKI